MCCCEDRYFILLCSLYTHSYFSSRTNAVIACNWALPRELYASLIWPLINFMDWCTVPFALLLKSSTAVMILSRSSLVAVCLSCLSVWVSYSFFVWLFLYARFFQVAFNNCLSFGVSVCFFPSLFYISESIWISISIEYMPSTVINYWLHFSSQSIVFLSLVSFPF